MSRRDPRQMGSAATRDDEMASIRIVNLALLAAAASIYGAVAALSPGYDDEFHNIRWFLEAQTGGRLSDFLAAASVDLVHPTGSYLLGFGLRALLGDWELVRLVKSLSFFLLGLHLLGRLFPGLAWRGLDLRVLVLLSPSLLLWCTGLRWFGEFTLLLLAALAADRIIDRGRWPFFPLLGLLLLAMLHTSYMGAVLAPIVLGHHLVGHPSLRSQARPLALTMLLLALGGALPLAAVLEAPRDTQTGPLLRSLAGTLHGLLVNHGVFPLSWPGAATLLATTSLFGLVIALRFRDLVRDRMGPVALAMIAAVALTGLGERFRNVTPLLPLVLGLALSAALQRRPGERPLLRRALAVSVLLFAATNLWGMLNVLGHTGTAKGSWNLPVRATVEEVRRLVADCPRALVVVWDPVLQHSLWEAGMDTADLRRGDSQPALDSASLRAADCVLVVWTYPGATRGTPFFSERALQLVPLARIGRDPDQAAKARLDPLVPDHYVTILAADPVAASRHARLFTDSLLDRLDR